VPASFYSAANLARKDTLVSRFIPNMQLSNVLVVMCVLDTSSVKIEISGILRFWNLFLPVFFDETMRANVEMHQFKTIPIGEVRKFTFDYWEVEACEPENS